MIESVEDPFLKPRPRPYRRLAGSLEAIYATPTYQVPASVKEAFCQLIGHWYRFAKTAPAQSLRDVDP